MKLIKIFNFGINHFFFHFVQSQKLLYQLCDFYCSTNRVVLKKFYVLFFLKMALVKNGPFRTLKWSKWYLIFGRIERNIWGCLRWLLKIKLIFFYHFVIVY